MLLRKYLLSSVYRDGENEKGAEDTVQQVRDKIKVTSNTKDDDGEPEVKEENPDDENKNAKGDEGKEEEEGKEQEQEKAEEDKEQEEVEAKEEDPAKLKRTIERLQKRIDKGTGKSKELQARLEAAEEKLKGVDNPLTEKDVELRAKQLADETVTQLEFNRACERLNRAAVKIDKKFNDKVDAMAEDIGPIQGRMIGMLDELDNGGAVLNYLADNVDETEEIYTLTNAKMAVRLTKIANELAEKDKKPAVKPAKEISKVPDPNKPINNSKPPNSATIETVLSGAKGVITGDRMKSYAELRARQEADKRKARFG